MRVLRKRSPLASTRRSDGVSENAWTSMRIASQAEQAGQLGRYRNTPWRRSPSARAASSSSLRSRRSETRSGNRASRSGRYGQVSSAS